MLGPAWRGDESRACISSGVNRRGGGIRKRVDLASVVPGLEAALVAALVSGLVAGTSCPSVAQHSVAGSRAATRAHARFRRRWFRKALLFTRMTPYSSRGEDRDFPGNDAR